MLSEWRQQDSLLAQATVGFGKPHLGNIVQQMDMAQPLSASLKIVQAPAAYNRPIVQKKLFKPPFVVSLTQPLLPGNVHPFQSCCYNTFNMSLQMRQFLCDGCYRQLQACQAMLVLLTVVRADALLLHKLPPWDHMRYAGKAGGAVSGPGGPDSQHDGARAER